MPPSSTRGDSKLLLNSPSLFQFFFSLNPNTNGFFNQLHFIILSTFFQVENVPSFSFFPNNLKNLDLADLWVHHPQWQAAPAPATDARCDSTNNADAYAYAPDKPRDKWAWAREIVFPANTTAPKASDNPNAGGVSSLVQKWRGFEARAKPPAPPPDPLPAEDDSIIADWESDRTVLSGRSSIPSRDSDATESERLRVADIIRKLTPNESGSVSPPRTRTSLDQCMPSVTGFRVRTSLDQCIACVSSCSRIRTSLDHQTEVRCNAPPPRIRGRQAYVDLLEKREREMRKELQGLLDRKPVSKFSHIGRIKAVLKIKLLRRGMEAKDNTAFRPQVNRKAHSGHLHFESLLKDNAPNTNSVRKEEVSQAKTCLKAHVDGSVRHSKQVDFCPTSLEANENANFLNRYEASSTTTTTTTTFINRPESSNNKPCETANSVEATSSIHHHYQIDKQKEDDEAATTTTTNYDLRHDSAHHPTLTQSYNNQQDSLQIVETAAYWEADFSQHEGGWEDLQSDCQSKEASINIDWIGEVSRPRSDWEYLRQDRYQEMLDPFSQNEEIRALLGRKSVSSFLSSVMREKIDQLMISRSQGQLPPNHNEQQMHQKGHQDLKALAEDEEGEYGDYENSEGRKLDEYVNPTTSHENQNQNRESSECSFQAASPSTQRSSTQYFSQDLTGRISQYSARPAFEMEVIYDLRRHMEQLHQEIAELRKSIKCCTDMQIKLHRSIKKEVTAALTHPDAKNGRRHPPKKGAGGRRCCVCCKVQVDCVLYRCGHMCTCFDCANELHWNSGNCPICRAEIVDVVRTHPNS